MRIEVIKNESQTIFTLVMGSVFLSITEEQAKTIVKEFELFHTGNCGYVTYSRDVKTR